MKKIKTINIKKGPMGGAEKEYIEKYMKIKSDEEIGKDLRRSPNQIESFRKALIIAKSDVSVAAKERERYLSELRAHPRYESLKKQFTKDEFFTFESEYVGMLHQFKEVTFTEQEQVFTYITFSILIDRLGEERVQSVRDIDRISKFIEIEYDKVKKDRGYLDNKDNKEHLFQLEQQLQAMKNSSTIKTKEYSDLDSRKAAITKEIKGTREQRIKRVEDSKLNFLGLMKYLDDEENRRDVGIEMLLHQEAAEQEKKRLGAYHEYHNGEVDRPLLSHETVGEDDKPQL